MFDSGATKTFTLSAITPLKRYGTGFAQTLGMSNTNDNTNNGFSAMSAQERVEHAQRVADLEDMRCAYTSARPDWDAALSYVGESPASDVGQRCLLDCSQCGARLAECPCEGSK